MSEAARPPRRSELHGGNRVRLLRNGAGFFPALIDAIGRATRSVALETYIFEADDTGRAVVAALTAAAARGVEVRVLVDGFGAGAALPWLRSALGGSAIALLVYRPERWWRLERRLLRRLHRKVAVVDDRIGFVGGINIIDDHHHPPGEPATLGPRLDFAVELQGPVVGALALASRRLWWGLVLRQLRQPPGPWPGVATLPPPPPLRGGVVCSLLLRDNLRNRHAIEQAYLQQLGRARFDVLIANAYFLPGRRFRAALIAAAARGVRVRLLLQGRVEYRLQHWAQQALYGQLLDAGVEIHEYLASFLHAKCAVIDDVWATVGSSNIDPYSLLMAREANVVVHDRTFARELVDALETAMAAGTRRLEPVAYARRPLLARLGGWLAYGVVRLLTVIAIPGRSD